MSLSLLLLSSESSALILLEKFVVRDTSVDRCRLRAVISMMQLLWISEEVVDDMIEKMAVMTSLASSKVLVPAPPRKQAIGGLMKRCGTFVMLRRVVNITGMQLIAHFSFKSAGRVQAFWKVLF
jgi:hypothetical protein